MRTIAEVIAAYFDGPHGEPDIADAHDYLTEIAEILEQEGKVVNLRKMDIALLEVALPKECEVIKERGSPRCPRCRAWLVQTTYQPIILAMIDPSIRYAVCCAGCGVTCVVKFPFTCEPTGWEQLVEAGAVKVAVFAEAGDYDWSEIERLQKAGVIR